MAELTGTIGGPGWSLSLHGSRARLEELSEEMEAALSPLGADTDALRVLAGFAVARAS